MKLKLTRPLVFLDAETTGLDVAKDRIITLATVKVHPAPHAPVKQEWAFNPGQPISPENEAIHGISNAAVKNWPLFQEHAASVHSILQGCDMAGFNTYFDLQIIWAELYRCGIEWDLAGVNVVDVGMIFKKKERRSLESAVPFYLGRKHEGAHGAMADTLATLEVFEAQTGGTAIKPLCEPTDYSDLGAMDVPALHRYCNVDDRDGSERLDLAGTIRKNKDGVPVFGTKRNQGVPVALDLGYADWILRSDFPAQTRLVLSKIVADIRKGDQEDLFQ